MRIIELCLSRDLGGLELYAYRCALALTPTDKVISVIHPEGKLRGYVEKAGLKALFLRHRLRAFPLLAARELARLVDRESMEVIHVHHGKDLPLAILAKVLSKRRPRVIYTRQMQITRVKRDAYHDFLYDNLDRMVTITAALAESARDKLRERNRDKVSVLYYGVRAPERALAVDERAALRAEWNVPTDGFLVGLFGRKEEAKGQHLMLEAVAALKSKGVNLYALVVGHAMNPAYAHRLDHMARELGIADRVVFRDFVDNPQRWMQACDAVALTTFEETFGLVLAEAMRARVAVVGSDRGGVPEIIDHGRTGLLFRSGDSVSLTEQLERLALDPAARARMAEAGRADADARFDHDHHFAELRRLFGEVMEEYRGPRLTSEPRTIGVIAWGLLGDVLIRIPIIEALRQRFPAARIVVLTDPWAKQALDCHPAIDHLIVNDRRSRPRLRYLRNFWRAMVALRKEQPELLIDLYGGGSSALVTRLSGARYRLGCECIPRQRRVANLIAPCISGCIHWAQAYGSILIPLGVKPGAIRCGTSFHYPAEVRTAVENHLTARGPYLGINVGARTEEKRWPIGKYVEFARAVAQRHGLTPLVFTNPGMEHLAKEFVEAYGKPCVNPPVLPLHQVAALMDRCDYVVTGDTALMHVAFGRRRPVLALFTHNRPEIVVAHDTPVVVALVEDPAAGVDECGRIFGTREMSVEFVLHKFDELLRLTQAAA